MAKEFDKKKEERKAMKELKDAGALNLREWNTTRKLYSQLCLLAVATNLLLSRVEKRMTQLHGVQFKQKQKQLFNRAVGYIQDGAKVLDEIEDMSSRLGWKGDEDFVHLNTILNSEGYSVLRFLFHWQNVTSIGGDETIQELENQMTDMTKGTQRKFSKKLIDTFKLNA